jgi:hypothetical protein
VIAYRGPCLAGCTESLNRIARAHRSWTCCSIANERDGTVLELVGPLDDARWRHIPGVALRRAQGTIGFASLAAARPIDRANARVIGMADAVVLVLDLQRARHEANVECVERVDECFAFCGRRLSDVPVVVQLNKADLPRLVSDDEALGPVKRFVEPERVVRTVATRGDGVLDALHAALSAVERTRH